MKIAALFALSLTVAVGLVAQDTAPVIEHDPSECFEVGSFPRLCAQVSADGSLRQARAYFRASRTTKWYYVDLAEEEGELCSALPSPLPETPGVEYYLEGAVRWTPFSGPKWGVAKVEPAELNTSWS